MWGGGVFSSVVSSPVLSLCSLSLPACHVHVVRFLSLTHPPTYPPYPHTAANFIRRTLATALRKGPYQTNLLLGGWDEKDGAALYYIDYMGSLQKVDFGRWSGWVGGWVGGYMTESRARFSSSLIFHSLRSAFEPPRSPLSHPLIHPPTHPPTFLAGPHVVHREVLLPLVFTELSHHPHVGPLLAVGTSLLLVFTLVLLDKGAAGHHA